MFFCSNSAMLTTQLTQLQFFFFNDPATTEIYTLSLHDALPIRCNTALVEPPSAITITIAFSNAARVRSEEHTSELQSPCNIVCRLLLDKKNIVRAFGGVDIVVSNDGAAWQCTMGSVYEATLRLSFELTFFPHLFFE